MGSPDLAFDWLLTPAIGLESRVPLDLLATAVGLECVIVHLTRIEHGVYC